MYLIVDGPIDLDGSVDTVGGWIVPIEWFLRFEGQEKDVEGDRKGKEEEDS